MNLKKAKDLTIGYPIHASAFITLFLLLLFLPLIRPPVILCSVLLIALVYLAMFFGARSVIDNQS